VGNVEPSQFIVRDVPGVAVGVDDAALGIVAMKLNWNPYPD
jgi:hypothetical protein